ANRAASSDLGAPGQTLTIKAGDTINVILSGANSTLFIDSSLSTVLQSTGVTITYAGHSSGDRLSFQVAADPTNAQTITLGTTPCGSLQEQENGSTTTLVSYTGVSLPVNLTVVTPGPADQIEMSANVVAGNAPANTAQFQSTSSTSTFGTVTVPFNASTVVG